jgi:ubiquinone/menaquinone biosynthesis C-methylase UbiE
MATPDSVFDAMADTYDTQFTCTAIGMLMRQAVWARLAQRFDPGCSILEMNCGTGEDALWLGRRGVHVLATDVSSRMLHVAERKLDGVRSHARVMRLSWEELDGLDQATFDGVLSNFGGLNCVRDLQATAKALARKIRPGGYAMLCIMGPVVPWEWCWYMAHGKPSAAFRRLRRGGAPWSGMAIHYPTIGQTRRAFAADFRVARVSAIGALLPPPYTERRFGRVLGVVRFLNRLERNLEAVWPLPWMADHYLMELQRR